jgi:VWFA-related protein
MRVRKNRLSAILCLLVAIAGMALPHAARAQVAQPAQNGPESEYTLKLNADIVVLSATVVDRHNALVSGLGKEDFQVYEDGVPQPIKYFSHEDLPVTAGIVIDNSGSMGPKRADVIAAALAFVRSSNPEDQMFVVHFNDHVSISLPGNNLFTDRQDQLLEALSDNYTAGQTSLYDGMAAALDRLKQGNRDKKVLILISDGGDNASLHTQAQVIEMAKRSAAIIYAIGIFDENDDDKNPYILQRFAKATGGEAFFPDSSKDIAGICEEIAHDIRNLYTLAYVPAMTEQGGSYRSIQVKANGAKRGRLSVRTRAGYTVPSRPEIGKQP